MTFKINIGTKEGNTFKLEAETEELIGKSLHDKIQGKDISQDLEGYEFEIAGASDKAGFTVMKDVEGIGLKKVLLTYGKGMKKRPRKEGKKKRAKNRPKGLRLRKTVRGKVISPAIVQINLKVLKDGNKNLSEIFPDQNKKPEPEVKPVEQKPAEVKEATPKKEEQELTQPEKEPTSEKVE
jgi:small subunit ribosomal protein S6e